MTIWRASDFAAFNRGTARARTAYRREQAALPCTHCDKGLHAACRFNSYLGGRSMPCSCARDSHRVDSDAL